MLGETAKYEDGLEITVAQPLRFHPSEYAAGADSSDLAMALKFTVTNNGTKNFDPSMMMVTAQSGQTQEEPIFDSAQGYTGKPDTVLLPGRTVTFQLAFTVTEPEDVVVEVQPGFEYRSQVFTSQ